MQKIEINPTPLLLKLGEARKFSKKFPLHPAPCGRGKPPLSRGLNIIADFFKRGKIVVYPTDTIYGLGCLATDKKAVKKIYRIKKRKKGKALLVLVSSLAMAKKYCYVNEEQEKFLREAWNLKPHPTVPFARGGEIISSAPLIKRAQKKFLFTPPARGGASPTLFKGGGPITAILKSKGILPKELAGKKETLAVRLPRPIKFGRGLPENDFLIKIIKKVGAPIVSTSANISGEEYQGEIEKISKLFNKKIDLIVDAGRLKSRPSTIIDIREMDNIKVIRK